MIAKHAKSFLPVIGVVFIITSLIVILLNAGKLNFENRGKAFSDSIKVNFSLQNTDYLSKETATTQVLPVRITDIEKPIVIDVNGTSSQVYKLSAVDMFLTYDTTFFRLDLENKSPSEQCIRHSYGFDNGNTVLIENNGRVRFTSFAIKENEELPSSQSCFGSLHFYPKQSTITSGRASVLFSSLSEWAVTGDITDIGLTSGTPDEVLATVCSLFKSGDFDCSGKINLDDFELFRSEFVTYKRQSTSALDERILTDVDYNAIIDVADFAVFREGYIAHRPAVTPLPTPTYKPSPTSQPTSVIISPTPIPTITTSKYRDGVYSADGTYTTEGNRVESIQVSLVLSNDIISSLTVTPKATDDTSAIYQDIFIDGINALVVGKPLDSATSVKNVGGSSDTPKGFVDAINKIKSQAL